MAKLGCGSYTVFITDKCGNPRICDVTDRMDSLEWNRVLDGISKAQVQIPYSAGTIDACCTCLADIEPWCHELHIMRDDAEVWVGPIQRIVYGYNAVHIEAADLLQWLTVRVLTADINCSNTPEAGQIFTLGKTTIQNMAGFLLQAGFDGFKTLIFGSNIIQLPTVSQSEFDDPCALRDRNGNEIVFKNDVTNDEWAAQAQERIFKAYDGTVFDQLSSLAEGGLNFTTVGRNIILVSNPDVSIGTIGVLTDEHIMGDVEITKDGANFATGVFVRWTGDDDQANCAAAQGVTPITLAVVPCPGFAGFTDKVTYTSQDPITNAKRTTPFCYGRVEKVFTHDEVVDALTADIIATSYMNASFPAPRTIDIPTGSRLSPDTPFDINQLIPGELVKCSIARACIQVDEVLRLQELSVHLSADGDEEVAISLGTIDKITSAF